MPPQSAATTPRHTHTCASTTASQCKVAGERKESARPERVVPLERARRERPPRPLPHCSTPRAR
eukprot:2564395-Prymnesium_polylepis.2